MSIKCKLLGHTTYLVYRGKKTSKHTIKITKVTKCSVCGEREETVKYYAKETNS